MSAISHEDGCGGGREVQMDTVPHNGRKHSATEGEWLWESTGRSKGFDVGQSLPATLPQITGSGLERAMS